MTIATAWQERTGSSIYFVVEGPESAAEYVQDSGFSVSRLDDGTSLEAEREFLRSVATPDLIIAEVLDLDWHRQLMLKEMSTTLVVFDDMLSQRYCADMVVCGQTIPRHGNAVLSSPETEFLIDPKYFVLDPAYGKCAKPEQHVPDAIGSVLVAFGGGMYDLAFEKTALALNGLDWTADTTFVLGPSSSADLRSRIRDLVPHAEIIGSVDNMASLLSKSDLAIVGGGYLKLEAAVCKTPAIMIATQWHQIPLAETMHKVSGMPYVGHMSYIEPADIRMYIDACRDPRFRSSLAEECSALVDCDGLIRVIDRIEALVNHREQGN